ncbi:hypothetical protein ABV522_24810 [Priestia megaterium]
MIGGQDEDSGRPRKAKSCTEIGSGVSSDPYEHISPICLPLAGCVLISLLCLIGKQLAVRQKDLLSWMCNS